MAASLLCGNSKQAYQVCQMREISTINRSNAKGTTKGHQEKHKEEQVYSKESRDIEEKGTRNGVLEEEVYGLLPTIQAKKRYITKILQSNHHKYKLN